MSKQLIEAITDMREEDALLLTSQLLNGGVEPIVVLESCRQAMGIIGKRFETGECFIPELILAGEILSQISAVVKPHLQQTGGAVQSVFHRQAEEEAIDKRASGQAKRNIAKPDGQVRLGILLTHAAHRLEGDHGAVGAG